MITSRPPRYLPAVGALALGALFPVVATSALPRPAFRLPHLAPSRSVAFAPQDTGAQSVLGAVRRSFRNLVIAQEAYFASHHAYTADLAKLATYRPEPAVSVARLGRHLGGQERLAGSSERPGSTGDLRDILLVGAQRRRVRYEPREGDWRDWRESSTRL